MTSSKKHDSFLSKPVNHFYLLILSAGILSLIGLVMVFSASSIHSLDTKGSSYGIVLRQLFFLVVSIPLAGWLSKLSLERWYLIGKFGLVLSIGLQMMLFVPGLKKTVNGNTNWINLRVIDVQPSELVKFLMILWASTLLAKKMKAGHKTYNVAMLITPAFLFIMAMIMAGKDLGTTIVIAVILMVLLFVSGVDLKILGVFAAIGATGVAFFILTASYRKARFLSFINPFSAADYKNAGWQPAHSILGLATGGIFGVGLGGSRQKWGNLAEAHTDFIFSVIGEELGLIGALTVLILLGLLVYSIFRIALRAKDPMVRYACTAIGCWIAIQAFMNIGSATSIMPVVGVTLPLVSYGGSALLATMCGLGFVAGAALRDPAVRKEVLAKISSSRAKSR
jgi:cell division protein FtsW